MDINHKIALDYDRALSIRGNNLSDDKDIFNGMCTQYVGQTYLPYFCIFYRNLISRTFRAYYTQLQLISFVYVLRPIISTSNSPPFHCVTHAR